MHPVITAVVGEHPRRTPEQVDAQREAARRALIQCAELSDAPRDGWRKDTAGVPVPQGAWHWSMAHTSRYAAAVIAKEPVGIDIERIRPRHADSPAEIAAAEEWALFGDRSWETFFDIWTAKEAVLKAVGIGISGLPRCRIVEVVDRRHLAVGYEARTWSVELYRHDGHVAAVTMEAAGIEWCVSR